MLPERFAHYKTGYQVLDTEHFELLTTAATISNLCKSLSGSEKEITDLLRVLCTQLHDHMLHEEELMRVGNYKYYAAHVSAHNELRFRFSKLLNPEKFDRRHIDYMIAEIDHIFIGHIDSYDMQIRLDPAP